MSDSHDRPVPAPLTLWSRLVAHKAILLAWARPDDQSAFDWAEEAVVLDGARLLHTDGEGDWFEIIRYGEERAVLYGLDGYGPFSLEALPYPFDLFAHAPSWAPVAELRDADPDDRNGRISFFHWQDAGHHHRAPTHTEFDWSGLFSLHDDVEGLVAQLYRDQFFDDDAEADDAEAEYAEAEYADTEHSGAEDAHGWRMAGEVDGGVEEDGGVEGFTDTDFLAAEAEAESSEAEYVGGWRVVGGVDGGVEGFTDTDFLAAEAEEGLPIPEEAFSILVELVLAVEDRSVTEGLVAAVAGLAGQSPETAVAWLTACGAMTGSAAPVESPPAGSAPPARRRRLTEVEHRAVVAAAMAQAEELDRPEPPRTEALEKLLDHAQAAFRAGRAFDVAFRVHVGAGGSECRASPVSFSPPDDDICFSPEIFPLIELAIQANVAERHPEHGSWLFLRVTADDSSVVVERRYDRQPAWWHALSAAELDRASLIEELGRRTPQWQPGWRRELADEYAWGRAG